MCRAYGDTVRLCFRTGRRGVRIPAAGAVWNASHRHVTARRDGGEVLPVPARRCAVCGTPAVSRHARLCGPCAKEAECQSSIE